MSGGAWEPPIAYTGAVTGWLLEATMYCEYRSLLEAKRAGPVRPGQARLLARRMLEAIRGARDGWARLTVAGEALGVPVIVSPDAVLVEKGRPRVLLRARRRRTLRSYPGDWAPLMLAALALDEALGGLDADLILALVLAVDNARLADALSAVKAQGPRPARGDGWLVSTRVYDRGSAEAALREPISLIAGRRRPRPPPPGRCAKCPWRGECPWARG